MKKKESVITPEDFTKGAKGNVTRKDVPEEKTTDLTEEPKGVDKKLYLEQLQKAKIAEKHYSG